MSLEQFESFSAVARIRDLETQQRNISDVNAAMAGKAASGAMRSIATAIAVIRSGKSDPEALSNAEMTSKFGPSLGILDDAGLAMHGIEVNP